MIPIDCYMLIFVGRLHPVKGLQYFIKALPELTRVFPSVRAVIAGHGPELSRIKQLCCHEHNVHLSGALNEFEIAELLSIADVFVHPSVNLNGQREGMPTSIMEAMAAGVPIVATRTGGIPELIRDGVNGLLVRPGNSRDIVTAVSTLLADPALREIMGRTNRASIQNRDWEYIAIKVFDVYNRVISNYHLNNNNNTQLHFCPFRSC
jgi:glycosyltransferase involved in cell wall biosynthesis